MFIVMNKCQMRLLLYEYGSDNAATPYVDWKYVGVERVYNGTRIVTCGAVK